MPFVAGKPDAGRLAAFRYTPPGAERPSRAGLLAPGSSRRPRLPGPLSKKDLASGVLETALPGHSCGGSGGFEPPSLFGPASSPLARRLGRTTRDVAAP